MPTARGNTCQLYGELCQLYLYTVSFRVSRTQLWSDTNLPGRDTPPLTLPPCSLTLPVRDVVANGSKQLRAFLQRSAGAVRVRGFGWYIVLVVCIFLPPSLPSKHGPEWISKSREGKTSKTPRKQYTLVHASRVRVSWGSVVNIGAIPLPSSTDDIAFYR